MTVGIWKATVTSKGQVTLPAKLRRHMGIEDGAAVIFQLWEDGTAEFRRATSISDLASLDPVRPSPAFEHLSWDEWREYAWTQAYLEHEQHREDPPPSSTPTS